MAGQERLGIELGHIRLRRHHVRLDKGIGQNVQRLRIEMAIGRKHRHHEIVFPALDFGIELGEGAQGFDRLGFVRAHVGDVFEPAFQKPPQDIGMILHGIRGGVDRVDQELLNDVRGREQQPSPLRELQLEADRRLRE